MRTGEVLAEGFERIREVVHEAVEGLSAEELSRQPWDGANTVGWLVWHLTRVQDDHVAEVAGHEQVWTADGWDARFALPLEPGDTGYGHTPQQMSAVRVSSADQLLGYYDAVHARTLAQLAGVGDEDLDRVVDKGWNPPVTLGVRLISVLADDLQHAGQAAYVRGVLRSGGKH
ncbi:DinB family protein [Streptomyces sp. NPDC051561]|uniref:mycothiol transferase n=1 Tax=Streptomyces sp. NPDC051561 TaxID=3365658 RepID=UPI0037BAE303